MHAVTIVDGTLEWREHPDPDPGPGELLVAVAAAGINAADLMQRQGFYPAPPGGPGRHPGLEFAGEVVGGGRRHRTASPSRRPGHGHRRRGRPGRAVPGARGLGPARARRVAWEEAGGFPEAFSTAHDALFTQAGLGAGERVLVSGAAGGVGTAAVQLAQAAGAHVVASVALRGPAPGVVRPGRRRGHRSRRGRRRTVPTTSPSSWWAAPGVAAVLPALATGGRIVVIGVGAGAKVELNLLALMASRATIGGSMLRARSLEEKAAVARAVEEQALPLLADGTVAVPVADRLPDARGRRRPTSGSPRAASSGRSSWSTTDLGRRGRRGGVTGDDGDAGCTEAGGGAGVGGRWRRCGGPGLVTGRR